MGKKRLAALAAATIVLTALAVAPVAAAWNPTLTASVDCNGVVSYVVSADQRDSLHDNPEIAIFDDSGLTNQVASGAFDSADNWSFSGTFTVPLNVTTLTITVEALGPWGDGHFESAPTSVTVSRPAACPLGSSTSTTVHDAGDRIVTAVAVGSTVHDAVTVSGSANGPTPTGLTTIDWFTNGSCTGTPAASSASIPLSAGQANATGFPQTPTVPGSYAFEAHYPGDAVYSGSSGPCEPLAVTPAEPSITTSTSGPVTIGGAVHDTATLTGAYGATGAVTFAVFGPGDSSCSTALQTVSTAAKAVDANGNGTYTSVSFTTTTVGVYRWRAFFAGDTRNAAASTACNDAAEGSTSNQATPTLATTASGPVTLGATIQDTATLTGAVSATGAITFKLYAPGDPSCTTAVATLGSASSAHDASGNGSYVSASFTTAAVGVYRWRAFFAGDADNLAASTACNDAAEGSTVNAPAPPSPPPPPPPTPTTTLTPTPTPAPAPSSPSIAITKNPKEQTILSGGTVTWTIVVANTGNVTLTNVRVTDAEAPGCARTSADIPALASMAPGVSLSYMCTRSGATASFTNVAIAGGTPPAGPDVTDTDTAHVTVNSPPTTSTTTPTKPLPPSPAKPKPKPAPPAHHRKTAPLKPPVSHPSISIVKDPKKQLVGPGGTATFRVTVSNTGDVPLHDVVVRDPRSQDCDRSLGTLAAGASQSYSCTRSHVRARFDNVATAVGKPPTGSSVTAHDHAPVTVAPLSPPVKQVTAKPPKAPKVGHHKPKMTG